MFKTTHISHGTWHKYPHAFVVFMPSSLTWPVHLHTQAIKSLLSSYRKGPSTTSMISIFRETLGCQVFDLDDLAFKCKVFGIRHFFYEAHFRFFFFSFLLEVVCTAQP